MILGVATRTKRSILGIRENLWKLVLWQHICLLRENLCFYHLDSIVSDFTVLLYVCINLGQIYQFLFENIIFNNLTYNKVITMLLFEQYLKSKMLQHIKLGSKHKIHNRKDEWASDNGYQNQLLTFTLNQIWAYVFFIWAAVLFPYLFELMILS